EAPLLGEAAAELFQQLSMAEFGLRPEQTALSLVAQALRAATGGDGESQLLDRSVLASISEFQQVLDAGIETVIIDGGDQATEVTRDGLQTVAALQEGAPPSRDAKVAGILDELAGSRRAFYLRLVGGQTECPPAPR